MFLIFLKVLVFLSLYFLTGWRILLSFPNNKYFFFFFFDMMPSLLSRYHYSCALLSLLISGVLWIIMYAVRWVGGGLLGNVTEGGSQGTVPSQSPYMYLLSYLLQWDSIAWQCICFLVWLREVDVYCVDNRVLTAPAACWNFVNTGALV